MLTKTYSINIYREDAFGNCIGDVDYLVEVGLTLRGRAATRDDPAEPHEFEVQSIRQEWNNALIDKSDQLYDTLEEKALEQADEDQWWFENADADRDWDALYDARRDARLDDLPAASPRKTP